MCNVPSGANIQCLGTIKILTTPTQLLLNSIGAYSPLAPEGISILRPQLCHWHLLSSTLCPPAPICICQTLYVGSKPTLGMLLVAALTVFFSGMLESSHGASLLDCTHATGNE